MSGAVGGMMLASYLPAVVSGGDPYWSNVTLLMHMDGSNGGTTFVDSKGGKTVTTNNVTTSTAQTKFGNASAVWSGSISTQQLSLASSTDWDISTGNWTIECWVYWTNAVGSDSSICCRRTTGTNGWAMNVYGFRAKVNGVWSDAHISNSSGITANTWHHMAWVRNGSTLRYYVDGSIPSGTTYTSQANAVSTIDNLSSELFRIGVNSNAYENSFRGYIDDSRFTKGVARYTSNFTPPTLVFPDN